MSASWSVRHRAAAAVLTVVCLLAGSRVATAQDPQATNDGAVVTVDAPMYWLRDTARTPMRQLPAGTRVRVLRRVGELYEVVYTDPKFGDEAGYVPAARLRLDDGASASSGKHEVLSQRGFIETRGFGFAQETDNDPRRIIGDALFREEVYIKPTRWLQFAGGIDLRANSYGQVEDEWRLDFENRSLQRPRAMVRRLTAAITTNHLTIDVGKQFIRWGRADILNPTDRFAPKDFINALDNELLPVNGVRTSLRFGSETIEGVWLPSMTPSRLPLLNQRWTVVPPEVAAFTLNDQGTTFPEGDVKGARWLHSGRFDLGFSLYDGFNHLPNVDVQVVPELGEIQFRRSYSALRTFGVETAVPSSVVTIKGEMAYFDSPSDSAEEYILYVIEAERQVGEWVLDGGYVGEVVTKSQADFPFGAERGIARSFIGRASYAAGPRRSVSIETAVRQKGEGFYAKSEYSQAFGGHWRLTLTGVGIGGDAGDFLGQYKRNSHVSAGLRLSF